MSLQAEKYALRSAVLLVLFSLPNLLAAQSTSASQQQLPAQSQPPVAQQSPATQPPPSQPELPQRADSCFVLPRRSPRSPISVSLRSKRRPIPSCRPSSTSARRCSRSTSVSASSHLRPWPPRSSPGPWPRPKAETARPSPNPPTPTSTSTPRSAAQPPASTSPPPISRSSRPRVPGLTQSTAPSASMRRWPSSTGPGMILTPILGYDGLQAGECRRKSPWHRLRSTAPSPSPPSAPTARRSSPSVLAHSPQILGETMKQEIPARHFTCLARCLCSHSSSRRPIRQWVAGSIHAHLSHVASHARGRRSQPRRERQGHLPRRLVRLLIAVPVKSFDSGDTNRDLHMIEATRGAQFPMIKSAPAFRRPKPPSNGFTPTSMSSSPARPPTMPRCPSSARSRAVKCASQEPSPSPVPISKSTAPPSSPSPSRTRSPSAST